MIILDEGLYASRVKDHSTLNDALFDLNVPDLLKSQTLYNHLSTPDVLK